MATVSWIHHHRGAAPTVHRWFVRARRSNHLDDEAASTFKQAVTVASDSPPYSRLTLSELEFHPLGDIQLPLELPLLPQTLPLSVAQQLSENELTNGLGLAAVRLQAPNSQMLSLRCWLTCSARAPNPAARLRRLVSVHRRPHLCRTARNGKSGAQRHRLPRESTGASRVHSTNCTPPRASLHPHPPLIARSCKVGQRWAI